MNIQVFQTPFSIIYIKSPKLGKSKKLRMSVPLWVIWILLIIRANPESICLESQLGRTKPCVPHFEVNLDVIDNLEPFVHPSTVFGVSCESDREMNGLTDEQKLTIINLYKFGRKIVKGKSHIRYLSKSIETEVIPKSFKINTEIPGNKHVNQKRLNKVSLASVYDEKERQYNVLSSATAEFEKLMQKLKQYYIT